MSWHMSPRYGHGILVSGYPVLTAVNWPYCECPMMSCIRGGVNVFPSSETQGSQSGRVKRRGEKSFQAWAKEPLGHRTISKGSRECWFLIGHKKCFVLFCPIGEQHLATVARFVHQAFLTRNEGTTDESKNVSDAISRSQFALRKFCFWRITMYRK